MKTDALIEALAADQQKNRSPTHTVVLAALAGAALSGVGLLATIGLREDLGAAFMTWRFDLKLAVFAIAMVLACIDTIRLTRPTGRALPSAVNSAPLLLLAAAVCVELILVAPENWYANLIGTNASLCLVAIPALSLAPLILVFVAMRDTAPQSALTAGVAVGRLSATIGALLYGLHCFDDSPLFVTTWYALAVLPIIGIAAIGSRLSLRW